MVTVLTHVDPRLLEAVVALDGVEVVPVPGDGEPDPRVRGDVLLTQTWGAPNLATVLERGVEWVHAFGTGVDAFPFDLLAGRPLTCSRGASAVPIAEFVLASMLAFEKGIPEVWADAPPEHWGMARLGGLGHRVLGLVGLGGIGTEVARLALAFGMRVLAVRRTPSPPPFDGIDVVPTLDALLPEADHLVLAVPATRRTRHLLDRSALARVKPGVHVVNVARGGLIDQAALIEALDDGRVARASLDVTDPEPLPPDHPLWAHPRVKLTPHISWSAPGSTRRLVDGFVENVRRWQAGEPLVGVVDVDEGY